MNLVNLVQSLRRLPSVSETNFRNSQTVICLEVCLDTILARISDTPAGLVPAKLQLCSYPPTFHTLFTHATMSDRPNSGVVARVIHRSCDLDIFSC